MNATIPCLILAGPTASGKSALAVTLAELVGGEIVNADSMQVYAGLPILTAIPDEDDRTGIPHHGYAVVDAAERHSVADWLRRAGATVAEIRGRGRVPILVGGTGMYIRAAMEGIAPLPDVPEATRREAAAMLEEMGGAAFRRRLAELDPALAARLEDGDSQRLVRGMEIALATGGRLSELQKAAPEGMVPGPLVPVLVAPPRDELYRRIDRRFPQMLEAGALGEAKAFLDRGLDPGLPLMKAVGLPPLADLLAGNIDEARAVELACRDTRRLAKRQMTWFRHRLAGDAALEGQETKQQLERILDGIMPKITENSKKN